MKVIDQLLYLIQNFLQVFNQIKKEEIEARTKNVLSILVFLWGLFFSTIIIGICISNKWLEYNKTLLMFFGITLFALIRYFIFQYYKNRYSLIIEALNSKYNLSKTRVILTFAIIWFISIFLLWISIIILRNFTLANAF
ncbi:MAG: hypothetical protein RIR55_1501 [Bacteroidota bacterium]|jgi:hypothetical protein